VQLLEDRKKRELLGRRAREIARAKYSWDIQIINVLRSYAEIVGHAPTKKTVSGGGGY